jgi:hypothetical protein
MGAYTGIPRLTIFRTYDVLQLPPCPELEALASQLRHLSDITLPLASASTTWRRCRQFAYKNVLLNHQHESVRPLTTLPLMKSTCIDKWKKCTASSCDDFRVTTEVWNLTCRKCGVCLYQKRHEM